MPADFNGKKPVFDLLTANGANKVLGEWVKRAGIEKSITWSCARLSYSILLHMYTINKPLFMLPFSLGCKMDILFGRKRLVYLLDFDAFIKVVNEMGFPLTWATEIRTNKMQSKMGKNLFINNNRGLVYDGKIEDGNIAESWLLTGWKGPF